MVAEEIDAETDLYGPVRFPLVVSAEDYQRLCREWNRRQRERMRRGGPRVTMRAIILDAIRAYLPEETP